MEFFLNFLSVFQKCNWFSCIDFESCNTAEFISCNRFYVASSGFCTYIMSSSDKDNFTYFQFWCFSLSIFFSLSSFWLRLPLLIKQKWWNGYLNLITDPGGKDFSPSWFKRLLIIHGLKNFQKFAKQEIAINVTGKQCWDQKEKG